MNEKVNIKEVAKFAGVSTATVSRAINTPDKVQTVTRKKIMDAINTLNYKPSTSTNSSNLIVFFTYNAENNFYNTVMKRFTELCAEIGYYVITCNTYGDKDVEAWLFEYFSKTGCAGIVFTGLTHLTNFEADCPVILLDDPATVNGSFYTITSDNEKAINILVDYLLRLNHKKIGFISGGPENSSGLTRQHIFSEYMHSFDLPVPDNYIFDGDFTIQSGSQAFDYFYSLPDMPSAIIAANDEMAKGFILRANDIGISIPTDISICGIDALENDRFQPKITSIHQNTDATAEAIFQIITAKDTFHNEPIVIPVSFSPGNTCYKLID